MISSPPINAVPQSNRISFGLACDFKSAGGISCGMWKKPTASGSAICSAQMSDR